MTEGALCLYFLLLLPQACAKSSRSQMTLPAMTESGEPSTITRQLSVLFNHSA
jgi:hypothetical protein